MIFALDAQCMAIHICHTVEHISLQCHTAEVLCLFLLLHGISYMVDIVLVCQYYYMLLHPLYLLLPIVPSAFHLLFEIL